MIDELLQKIEELINDCPSDWAAKAAKQMGKSDNYVRKVRYGLIGKRNHYPQIILIEKLKEIANEYQNSLTEATQ